MKIRTKEGTKSIDNKDIAIHTENYSKDDDTENLTHDSKNLISKTS